MYIHWDASKCTNTNTNANVANESVPELIGANANANANVNASGNVNADVNVNVIELTKHCDIASQFGSKIRHLCLSHSHTAYRIPHTTYHVYGILALGK